MATIIQNNTLEDLLKIETSRRNTDIIADLVLQKPRLFEELMAIFLANREPVSRRAAWVIDTTSATQPELVFPYLPQIAESLTRFNHDGLKRHSLHILSRSPLPADKTGFLINLCFDWLVSPKESVATKVYCMEILYTISLAEPDLRQELADTIEIRMHEETPGYRSKGRKILQKLSRDLRLEAQGKILIAP